MDRGWTRLAVPFGNEEVLTEGTRGAGSITGGSVVPEDTADRGAPRGATGGIGWGMDRLGMLPIPKDKGNTVPVHRSRVQGTGQTSLRDSV